MEKQLLATGPAVQVAHGDSVMAQNVVCHVGTAYPKVAKVLACTKLV